MFAKGIVLVLVVTAGLIFLLVAIKSPKLKPNDAEIKSRLTGIQYRVTQLDGTEPPFRNEYWDNAKDGIYVDVVSGEPLFSSKDKYKSGTGWPSFTQPLVKDNIVERTDYKMLLPRTEVRSKQGDSHLGHVFNDGPATISGTRGVKIVSARDHMASGKVLFRFPIGSRRNILNR